MNRHLVTVCPAWLDGDKLSKGPMDCNCMLCREAVRTTYRGGASRSTEEVVSAVQAYFLTRMDAEPVSGVKDAATATLRAAKAVLVDIKQNIAEVRKMADKFVIEMDDGVRGVKPKPIKRVKTAQGERNAARSEAAKPRRGAVLDEAGNVINGERQDQYGNPEDSFRIIAGYWSVYLGIEVKPQQVADLMVLFKIARNQGPKGKRDNYRDAAGYIGIAADMQGGE